MAKRPDMQVVGEKISRLRREKGLCAAAFAREIEQPLWLVMLLESAHTEQAQQLLDLLPDSVFDKLLRDIREVYGMSQHWLTTRYQSPRHPPQQEEVTPIEPLMLSFCLTPDDAIDLLDDLLKLVLLPSTSALHRDSYIRRSIKSISLLYHLQLAALQQHNGDALASQHRRQFNELLHQRISDWEQKLGLTENDPDAPSPA